MQGAVVPMKVPLSMDRPWNGKVLRISYWEFPPWSYTCVRPDGRRMLAGMLGYMLSNITFSLNMTYTLSLPKDGWFFGWLPNGTLMGMHGAVLAGDADLTAGPSPLEENFQRELHMPPASIDSHLVMVSGMRKAYVSQNESFVTSFDGTVWLLLFLSFLVLMILIGFAHRRDWTVHSFFQIGFELFQILVQQVTKSNFGALYAEVLHCIWLLTSFILAQSFAGQSRANLIVQAPTERIDTSWDLIARPKLKAYYLANSQIASYIKGFPGERGAALKQHMERNSQPLPITEMFTDSIRNELVDKKSMIFIDTQAALQAVYRWCAETNYYFFIGRENVYNLASTWYTSRLLGKPLIDAMDMQVLWSRAYGVQYVPQHELYKGNDKCIPGTRLEQSNVVKPTTIPDLYSIFELYAFMTAISINGFLIEWLWSKCRSCCAKNP
ncbi:uncharacterized protein LOC111269819 [Varroa jacobsoni]|uniref:uncharacterized protein LOC111269819 n=1 Tax=Varroa jacobsoni TaxID=62625 RepID=UPI000BF2B1B3|nr:uncharacterized protein LOC111269819 [Varroa jacobsoni]XP_022705406.1 uncharacterized protein LOC111269819 [Varroa jacobsoni]XP_022705407.1 uncharacterized protein LOC111269819 [Varroa jacobsoni]